MNAPARRKRRSSRTALVLGGGGFTGGVYQIGALRALDLLSVQPLGESVRHLRRHERRLPDRLVGGQRRHPRADDATVNDQVPHALPPLDREMLLRLNKREFATKALKLPLHAISVARNVAALAGLAVGRRPRARPRRRAALGHLHRRGRRGLRAQGALRGRPHRRLPAARARALPGRDRSRHLRADRARRRGLGRHPDLRRRPRLDRAADDLRPLPRPRARAGRRRHRLDHQPRHRRRGGREVHRRRQPARPLRQRLLQDDPDAVRHARPPRLGHGPPADRLPGLQADGLPAPARDGRASGRTATRASTSS